MSVPAAQMAVLIAPPGALSQGGEICEGRACKSHEYGDSGPLSSAQGDLLNWTQDYRELLYSAVGGRKKLNAAARVAWKSEEPQDRVFPPPDP